MRNALLVITLTLGFGLAHAATPTVPDAVPEPKTSDGDTATAAAKPDLRAERHCIRDTGTRLRARDKNGCISSAPGRSYGHDDIERTGETDVASALQHLDPSITTRGN